LIAKYPVDTREKRGDGRAFACKSAPVRGKGRVRLSGILINRNIVWTFQLFRRILAGVATLCEETRNHGAEREFPKNAFPNLFARKSLKPHDSAR
jgi:hypothetical protein